MTLLAGTALLTSCEANLKSAPPVTAAFIQSGRREHADARTLTEGRQVFLNRCIACHALPDVSQLDPARIPGVVGWMSGRAHLTAEQKQALIKYLLTVKAQS
ncbi:MAG TPA: cytochrome c [Chthoniobacterales bacterium]